LEKYEILLNNLIEEQEKYRTAVFKMEKMRLEIEHLKKVLDTSN
jgi:hypothetical protein